MWAWSVCSSQGYGAAQTSAPRGLGARNHPPSQTTWASHPTHPGSAQTPGFYVEFCALSCMSPAQETTSAKLAHPWGCLYSILGNNRKTKVNLVSPQILLQETTPKEQTCCPTQQEKLTLHRDRKEVRSGSAFPVGVFLHTGVPAFRAAGKQHHRD